MSNSTETIFADGFFVSSPRDNAPDFVMGDISISKDKAIAFINANANDRGYVNLDLLMGKTGQPYLKLNTFTPQPKADGSDAVAEVQVAQVAEATGDDLPF